MNLLIACLLEKPGREKFARECLDLLDILLQQHEHEKNTEEQKEHAAQLQHAAQEVLAECAKEGESTAEKDLASGLLSPDLPPPTASPIKKIVSEMGGMTPEEDGQVEVAIVSSEDTTAGTSVHGKLPSVEGFLRDEYYRSLGDTTQSDDSNAMPTFADGRDIT